MTDLFGPGPLAAQAEPAPEAAGRPPARRFRMPTVVLGFVLGLVAGTVWAVRLLDATVSVTSVLIVVLVGSGSLLVLGAVTAGRRDGRRS